MFQMIQSGFFSENQVNLAPARFRDGDISVYLLHFHEKTTKIVPLSLHSNLQSLLGITIKLCTPIRF